MRFRLPIWFGGITALFVAYIPQLSQAAILVLPSCIESGNCYTCDLIGLFSSIASLILGLISGIVLFALTFGGFMWIYSAGNTEKVQKGIQIIFGAIFGLIFVLTGWVMVNVAIAALMGNTDFSAVKIFGNDWEEVCRQGNTPTAVTSCVDQMDGNPCSGGSCTADSCSCLNHQCVDECAAQDSRLDGTGYEATCVPDDNQSCAKLNGNTPMLSACGAGNICCVYKSITTPE